MRKPAITIRMGAPYWDITIHNTREYICGTSSTVINMRGLTKEQQRKVIFETVKACREAGRVVT